MDDTQKNELEDESTAGHDTEPGAEVVDSPAEGDGEAPKRYPWELMGGGSVEEIAAEAPLAPAPVRGGGKTLAWAMGMLMLLVLLVGALSLKLWIDRTRAQSALRSAVTVASRGAGLDSARIQEITTAVSEGRFGDVEGQMTKLSGAGLGGGQPSSENAAPGLTSPLGSVGGMGGLTNPAGGGVGGGQGGAPQATDPRGQLPAEALTYLQGHREIAQAFSQAIMAGAQLKQRGGNVEGLRRIRDDIVAAARLEDTTRIKQLLLDFRKEFDVQAGKLMARRGPGGRMPRGGMVRRPGGAAPRGLMMAGQQAMVSIQQAQAQGKDVRAAMALMRRAEEAGRARDFAGAERLAKQATAAARSAAAAPPQPELFRNPLVGMFLSLLRVEDSDLKATLDGLKQAYAGAKTATVESLTATVKQATETIAKVGARRQAFGTELKRISGGGQPPKVDRAAVEAQVRKRAEQTKDELGAMLTRVHDMSAEDLAANRDKLVNEILELVFTPQPQAPTPAGTGPAVTPATTPTGAVTREQVQQKLLSAAGPYLDVRKDPAQKELADKLASTFAEARTLLTQGKVAEADAKANEGIALLPVEAPAPGTQ